MGSSGDFKIKVDIVAQDSSGPGLASIEQNLQGVESALDKIKAKSNDVGGSGMKELADNAVRAQAATDKLHVSVGRSTSVLQDMGRIILDMPYGIMGIGNNIQPLVESFGRLKTETGGVGGAVQAVIAEIGGPMGLAMIGIPLVTSLAVAFSGPLIKAIGGANESVEDFKNKIAGISDYKELNIAVNISGLSQLNALERRLDVIGVKMRMVKEEEALQKRKDALPGYEWNDWRNVLPGNAFISMLAVPAREKISSDETARWRAYGKELVGGMREYEAGKAGAKLLTYGETRNELALKAIGYSQNQITLFNEHLQVLGEKAAVSGEKLGVMSKATEGAGHAGAGVASSTAKLEAAAKAAEVEQSRWNDAVKAGDNALQNMGDHLPTVAEATAKVESAVAEYHRLKAAGDNSVEGVKVLVASTLAVTEAQHGQRRAQEGLARALKAANSLLDKSAVSELSVIDAKAAEATARLNVEQAKLSGNEEIITAATEKYNVAIDNTGKAIANSERKAQQFSSALKTVGDLLGGRVGDALAGMGVGLKLLMTEPDTKGMTTSEAQQAKDLQQISGISSLVSGLGQIVGGSTGSSISSLATGVASGMGTAVMLGAAALGPVGIIAGALGGALGLLGGGSSGPKQDQVDAGNTAATNTKALFDLANAGSAIARQMVVIAKYNQDAVSGGVYGQGMKASSFTGLGVDSYLQTAQEKNLSIFYTKENSYNAEMINYLDALNQIDAAIKLIASPSYVKVLDDINWKYQELAAKSGNLADAETARFAEMTIALTGFTNDSLSAVLDGVVTSTNPADVGAAFSSKVTDALATSIRQIQIGAFLQAVITPVLQPLYAGIAQSMSAGTDTTAGFTAIKSALETLTPQVNAFVQSLTTQGIAGYTAVAVTDTLTTATEALTTAQRTAVDVAQERYGLETTLLQLQGDTLQLRARDLALLDPSNRALQEQIWALQDQQSAASAAASATSGAADSLNGLADAARALQDKIGLAMQTVTKSVTAQKDAQQKIYDSAAKVLNDSLSTVASTISKLTGLNDDLQAAFSAMTMQEGALDKYKTAQQDIFSALATAKGGGALPLDGQLKSALSTVSQDSTGLFGSRLDYQRDFFRTVSAVTALSALAGSQLTDAQQSQSLQQSQLDALTAGFNAEQSRLDALLNESQNQVAAANGTAVAVLSVADAVKELYELLGRNAPGSTAADRVVFGQSNGLPAPVSDAGIVAVLQGIRDDLAAQNAQIAINTRDTAQVLEWWRVNGMPAVEVD